MGIRHGSHHKTFGRILLENLLVQCTCLCAKQGRMSGAFHLLSRNHPFPILVGSMVRHSYPFSGILMARHFEPMSSKVEPVSIGMMPSELIVPFDPQLLAVIDRGTAALPDGIFGILPMALR